jgi:hypothetical protein
MLGISDLQLEVMRGRAGKKKPVLNGTGFS